METFYWVAGIYLLVGLYKALNHINSGRVGLRGPWVTLITITFLWPFF